MFSRLLYDVDYRHKMLVPKRGLAYREDVIFCSFI